MEASRTTALPICSPQLLANSATYETDAVEQFICSLPGTEDALHFKRLCCVTTCLAQDVVECDLF